MQRTENAIRQVVAELRDNPQDFVGLADVRERLAQMGITDREAVDEALRSLARSHDVRVIPVANTKALQPRDRAAAVRIGPEENHAIQYHSRPPKTKAR